MSDGISYLQCLRTETIVMITVYTNCQCSVVAPVNGRTTHHACACACDGPSDSMLIPIDSIWIPKCWLVFCHRILWFTGGHTEEGLNEWKLNLNPEKAKWPWGGEIGGRKPKARLRETQRRLHTVLSGSWFRWQQRGWLSLVCSTALPLGFGIAPRNTW